VHTPQSELVKQALGCPCRDGDVAVLQHAVVQLAPPPVVPVPPVEPKAA
jgi:hypothetical protein